MVLSAVLQRFSPLSDEVAHLDGERAEGVHVDYVGPADGLLLPVHGDGPRAGTRLSGARCGEGGHLLS